MSNSPIPDTLYLNAFNFGNWRWIAKSTNKVFPDVGSKTSILYSVSSNVSSYYPQENPKLVYLPFLLNENSTVTTLSLNEEEEPEKITINPRSFGAFSWFNLDDTISFNNSSYKLMHEDSTGFTEKGMVTVTKDNHFEFEMSPNNIYLVHKIQNGEVVTTSRPLILIRKNGEYLVKDY